MWNKIFSFFSILFLTMLVVGILHSCANIAAPGGGPRDFDPPVPLRASPDFYSLNVSPSRVEITFDENIRIVRPMENVIITPPQINMPVVRAIARRAIVEFSDELLPNTTYTIDFTSAIVDNNEGNPLENFVFSFSTGDQLDTLSISGRVLSAYNLEPQQGILVGIHSVLDDSAFTNIPFERNSRTNSHGDFTIRGMREGTFRLFALNDLNRNFRYDNPQEDIAFFETTVSPSVVSSVRQDTIFNLLDDTIIDTILTVGYTRFLPDDLLLRTFVSDFQRKFRQRHDRTEDNKLEIIFGAPTELPTFSLIDPEISGSDWYVMERNITNDSIMLWITDSMIYRMDTIRMEINYLRTDTLDMHVLTTDTISFNIRRAPPPREREQRRGRTDDADEEEEDEEPEIRFLGIRTNVQPTFELFNPIRIEFEQPIVSFDSTYVRLALEVDTIFTPVPFRLEPDSLNPRRYTLRPDWVPGGRYKLSIDSAAIFSRFDIWNDKLEQTFTVKTEDQYGNLTVNIEGVPEGKAAFVQLLDRTDKPFRQRSVIENVATFQDLPPGEIFMRLVVDENDDGVWTTGNFEEGRQPEMVYYFHNSITIRAFTDHTVLFDVLAVPLIEQKPLEITQNQPEERRRDPELERQRELQQRQQQQRTSPLRGGRD
jgi:hypothetical protein